MRATLAGHTVVDTTAPSAPTLLSPIAAFEDALYVRWQAPAGGWDVDVHHFEVRYTFGGR